MIAYITGNVLEILEDHLIILTSSGLGYQVFCPRNVLAEAGQKLSQNEIINLHTHTHYYNDDKVVLFGFSTLYSRQLFELLIKTSGVGPKIGIHILSEIEVTELLKSVENNNPALLKSISGVGQKTAHKLMLDLKDLFAKNPDLISDLLSQAPADKQSSLNSQDLVSALVNMGYKKQDVLPVVSQAINEEAGFEKQLKKALFLLLKQ